MTPGCADHDYVCNRSTTVVADRAIFKDDRDTPTRSATADPAATTSAAIAAAEEAAQALPGRSVGGIVAGIVSPSPVIFFSGALVLGREIHHR